LIKPASRFEQRTQVTGLINAALAHFSRRAKVGRVIRGTSKNHPMKKKQANHKKTSQFDRRVFSNHPLVGTWEEEPASGGTTTTVAYTVFVKRGKFGVSAIDGEDGTVLRISQTKWDGEALYFTSLYPRSNHRARHVLRALSKGKMSHDISCTYSDGEFFSGREVWRKRREKKKHGSVQNTQSMSTL
jgi:hypothetical protein